MSTIAPYVEMVEDCIRDLGLDPTTVRGQKEGQWDLVRGSARVWIDVWHIERENRPYIQAMSPVMKMPPESRWAEFYQELAEINYKLYGCAFCKYNEWIYLKVIRECEGLDKSEAFAMITRIGNYADDYDDYLKNKYEMASGFTSPGGLPGPTKF